ncbi:MAG: hypothetical protein RBU24_15675 [Kiritimatiellia bacterium]|jgi:hypothetical protein|nr:hypothetical protein [Kiritimatiellia bacterium]
MRFRLPKTHKADKKGTPTSPCTYRRNPDTDLWKGEDGKLYRLDTHSTKPPHLELIRVKGATP